jgi:hypothetical protein
VPLQRDESATPGKPSSTVIAYGGHCTSMTRNVSVPLPFRASEHSDQTFGRRAAGRPTLRVLRSDSPLSVAGSDVDTSALSRSVTLLEGLYQALELTDPRELEICYRWSEPERRNLEEPYGQPA